MHNFDQIINRQKTNCEKWDHYNQDILPMWVADSDFKSPKPIINALKDRVEHGIFGYPIITENYGKAAKHWFKTRHDCLINEEDVIYINSVVPGLVDCIHAFTNKNDKILIQTPVYPPFHSVITASDRIKVINPLLVQDNYYGIDFVDLEKKLSDPELKMMILCSPHNPVGRVWTKEELTKIGNLCLKYNVIIVSDDIHQDYAFAPSRYVPIFNVSEEIKNISVILINPSKTFNIAGLRSAAIIAPNQALRNKLIETIDKRHTASPSVFGLLAFETAYFECADYTDEINTYLYENKIFAENYFKEYLPKITVTKSESTYLLWLDFKNYAKSNAELMEILLNKGKIALNCGSFFGEDGEGYFRLNFACPRKILEDGLNRIKIALEDC